MRCCGPAIRWAEFLKLWRTELRPGLGSYANWDERLDGRLAGAVMSSAGGEGGGDWQWRDFGAVGWGRRCTMRLGMRRAESESAPHTKFSREHNNAGGLEGGVTNGEDVVVRGYLKPISTLRRPLAVGELFQARDGEGGV